MESGFVNGGFKPPVNKTIDCGWGITMETPRILLSCEMSVRDGNTLLLKSKEVTSRGDTLYRARDNMCPAHGVFPVINL